MTSPLLFRGGGEREDSSQERGELGHQGRTAKDTYILKLKQIV